MRRLTVENFSVITKAELDFSGLNVIIGPQASGKSLLCKLAYFFLDIVSEAVDAIAEETPFDVFKAQTKDRFLSFFDPVDTWTTGKFKIDYLQGPFAASVSRTSYSGTVGTSIRLSVCQEFSELYKTALRETRGLRERARSKEGSESGIRPWEVRELARKTLRGIFKGTQSEEQIYIPAGRAFFTTYSKAIAVFQSRSLDPVTARFGEMMDWMLDEGFTSPLAQRRF